MVNNNFSEEERQEIISYSMQRAKVSFLFFIFVLLAGAVLEVFLEGLLFWLSFCCIRKYAGGYHADSQYRCSVISGSIIIVVFLMLKCTIVSMPVGILLHVGAYVLIMALSPVESKNRMLINAEKKRFRKKTQVISSVLFFGTLFFYFKGNMHLIWPVIMAYMTVALLLIAGICKLTLEHHWSTRKLISSDKE